jgi:hypothetical protein
LHCRSGGGFAQLIQTTTNARLFSTAQNLFVCHHFGNAVVISRFVRYAQWMGVGLQNQCSQFDSDTELDKGDWRKRC